MRNNDEMLRCKSSVSSFSDGVRPIAPQYYIDILHFTSFCLDGGWHSFRVNINKNIDMVEDFFGKKLSGENESQV